jgi:IS5 family transposase
MGRNHLIGRHGDATNAILAAVGYNFRRLLAWLAALLCLLRITSLRPTARGNPDNSAALRLQPV